MLKTLECASCGQLNEVETQKFPENEQVDVNKWTSKIGGSEQQEKYVGDGFWKKMKKHASKIPFAKEAIAIYYCGLDPKTPTSAKFIAFGALAYLVLPFDLIPDFILVLGYSDDDAAFWVAYNKLSAHITDEHREKAEDWLNH
jgi:uncharacterized membrane protein YkvA (DUF1232 family)